MNYTNPNGYQVNIPTTSALTANADSSYNEIDHYDYSGTGGSNASAQAGLTESLPTTFLAGFHRSAAAIGVAQNASTAQSGFFAWSLQDAYNGTRTYIAFTSISSTGNPDPAIYTTGSGTTNFETGNVFSTCAPADTQEALRLLGRRHV